MADARAAALAALLHVDENEGFSNLVLDKTLARFALEPRDAALASAIFYGVLERRLTLDYYIGQFARTPIHKMTPQVREILRIGAYQILYLEKIPPSAAVNVAVELAKQNKAVKASGFINAVLRNLVRSREKLQLPDEKENPLRHLSLKYSCPEWLISLWQKAYGPQCTGLLLDSLSEHPPIYIRLNNTKGDEEYLLRRMMEENVKVNTITWIPHAAVLEASGSVSSLDAFPAFLSAFCHRRWKEATKKPSVPCTCGISVHSFSGSSMARRIPCGKCNALGTKSGCSSRKRRATSPFSAGFSVQVE